MPFTKAIPDPHEEGELKNAYHVATELSLDWTNKRGRVLIESFSSKAAREAGKSPVAERHYEIVRDGLDAVKAVDEVPAIPDEPEVHDDAGDLLSAAIPGRAAVPAIAARPARPSFDEAFPDGVDQRGSAERYVVTAFDEDFGGAVFES